MAAAAAMLSISCEKQEQAVPQEEGMGYLTIKALDATLTKSDAYDKNLDFEQALKNVQALVFNEEGELESFVNMGSSSRSGEIRTKVGKKTVWVVANGPDLSGVKTVSEVGKTVVSLADNNKTDGFIMAGEYSSSVILNASTTFAVQISRLVARVALTSITNSIPAVLGDLKVERVFLTNVVGNQNLAGTAEPSLWYNKEGRADETSRQSSHIIDGSTYKASLPDMTYADVGQTIANGGTLTLSTPYLFYTYPNSSSSYPNGFSDTFSAQKSVLVVVATVNGKLQYYPVILKNGLARNTSATVTLTILGFGGDDPNMRVDKGDLAVDVKIENWRASTPYDETI